MNSRLDYIELEQLFQKTKDGNERAFAQIYYSTYKAQYYMAYQLLQNQHFAEEVVQETYINFYKNIHHIENAKAIIAYLNRINYHLCLKYKKEMQRKQSLSTDRTEHTPDQNGDPLAQLLDQELSSDISVALEKLPDNLRAALLLRYQDELKIDDIAFIMDASPRTVKRYLKEGVKALKNAL